VRLEEFPIGGLRGVCFEAEANITSGQGRGNKKQSLLMALIKKPDVQLIGHGRCRSISSWLDGLLRLIIT
jgi:hypothetical protein